MYSKIKFFYDCQCSCTSEIWIKNAMNGPEMVYKKSRMWVVYGVNSPPAGQAVSGKNSTWYEKSRHCKVQTLEYCQLRYVKSGWFFCEL